MTLEKHLEALRAVKKTGLVNMLDANGVLQVLFEIGYNDTVDYLANDRGRVNREKYLELIKSM